MRDIPAGTTATYGEIAARVGSPREARDVGEACAANKLAVVVPCHRIVKKDGSISGYRWGVRRKRALLEREHRARLLRPSERHPTWSGIDLKMRRRVMKSWASGAAAIVVSLFATQAFAQSGNAARGERVFNQQCKTCHTLEKGPRA